VNSRLHRRAIRGGTDIDGSPIFVGRALHNGFFLPAKVIPAKRSAYISKAAEFFIFFSNLSNTLSQRIHFFKATMDSKFPC
jgi:Protein of unknown function (DUF3421)